MIETEEFVKVNEQSTKLFAVIAHDVRGPIELIRSAVNYIKNEQSKISPDELAFLLTRFDHELETVSEMLNNLLQWAKERQYGVSVHPTQLCLSDETALSFKMLNSYAAQKQIELCNQVDDNIIIWTDKDMLQVILRNLISNAIKFSFADTRVTVKAMKEAEIIEVSVIDSGMGMNEAVKQKILNNKKVNSGYGTAKEKGVGLGLSITKEFIEKLGGELNISSVIGKGTNVSFTLPLLTI